MQLVDLIKKYEGFSPSPYMDVHGEYAIGYGNVIPREYAEELLTSNVGWNEKQAAEALKSILKPIGSFLKQEFPDLAPPQRDAVASLVYNIGRGAFKRSKAYKALKKNDIETFMHEAFHPERGFVRGGGRILPGLVERRAAEREMFSRRMP